MPEISRFMGVVIAMYYNDHAPQRRPLVKIEPLK